MVSTKNTTIYIKEINSEKEKGCETQGRQMDNRCMFLDTRDALTREQNPAILVLLWRCSQDGDRKRTGGTGQVH